MLLPFVSFVEHFWNRFSLYRNSSRNSRRSSLLGMQVQEHPIYSHNLQLFSQLKSFNYLFFLVLKCEYYSSIHIYNWILHCFDYNFLKSILLPSSISSLPPLSLDSQPFTYLSNINHYLSKKEVINACIKYN